MSLMECVICSLEFEIFYSESSEDLCPGAV
jgi:hypothetical protein